jgi:hypothetical protein
MIDTSSRPKEQEKKVDRYMEMPPRPKRKLSLYIPRIMAETMLVATVNSTSVYLGFNHMSPKHNVLFTNEQVENCD